MLSIAEAGGAVFTFSSRTGGSGQAWRSQIERPRGAAPIESPPAQPAGFWHYQFRELDSSKQ